MNNNNNNNNTNNTNNNIQHHRQRPPNHLNPQPSTSSSTPNPPSSWPIIDTDDPTQTAPPYHPLSSNQQATLTTFPSRLRLGTSSLAQPIYTTSYIHYRLQRPHSPIESHPPSTNPAINLPPLVSEPGKRARRVVNYAENDSSRIVPIDPDLDQHPNHPSSFEDDHNNTNNSLNSKSRSAGTRGRLSHSTRQSLGFNNHLQNTPTTTQVNSDVESKKILEEDLNKRKYGDGKSYLGQDPPAKLIRVEARNHQDRSSSSSNIIINSLASSEKDLGLDDVSLVPIRIEFDTDQLRIRDVFTWNLQERYITPEMFSKEFCSDAGIQSAKYGPQIVEQINSQLEQYSYISSHKLTLDESQLSKFSDEQLIGIEPDLRVVIQLDVHIETLHLIDRIEWDLGSNLTPELFTAQYICELNLPRSASPIIAHAIHEEIFRHKRECISLGLISQNNTNLLLNLNSNNIGTTNTTNNANTMMMTNVGMFQNNNNSLLKIDSDPLLKEKYSGSNRAPKKLDGIWRDWNESNLFGPKFFLNHVEDLEFLEIEKERLARRARREPTRMARRR